MAVSLVCERLTNGHIVAVDRSRKMIAAAERRNSAHVSAGRARFVEGTFERADLGEERFDKVFAFHVAGFWRRPEEWLPRTRRLLAPGGRLYLFNQEPAFKATAAAERFGERVAGVLRSCGFAVEDVLVREHRPSAVCIVAS